MKRVGRKELLVSDDVFQQFSICKYLKILARILGAFDFAFSSKLSYCYLLLLLLV